MNENEKEREKQFQMIAIVVIMFDNPNLFCNDLDNYFERKSNFNV